VITKLTAFLLNFEMELVFTFSEFYNCASTYMYVFKTNMNKLMTLNVNELCSITM